MKKLATNFSPDMIPKINAVLKFVLESPLSDFYRKKYGEKPDFYPVRTYGDFLRIPLLAKKEFALIDVEKRTFVPEDEVKNYVFSSGTFSKIPVPIPLGSDSEERFRKAYLDEEKMSDLGVDSVLFVMSPLSVPLAKSLKLEDPHVIIIPASANNLKLAARMAYEAEVQGIRTTPSRLLALIPFLKNKGFDLKKIKWISLSAETCTTIMLERFRFEFPSALIKLAYGNSEVGQGEIGIRCDQLNKKEPPYLFHPSQRLMEIAGDDGNVLGRGETGKIIHTDLSEKAFPLIRYSTEDVGSLERKTCPCGKDFLLTLEGRVSSEYLQTEGFVLSARSISKALEKFSKNIEPRFQMHVSKNGDSYGFQLRLCFLPKNEISPLVTRQNLEKSIISDKKEFFAMSTEDFWLESFEVKWIDEWEVQNAKAKSIICDFSA